METLQDRRQAALDRLQRLASARAAQNQMMMQKAESRYEEYMAEMRRREEEARKKASGNWLSNTLGGAFSGALTGLISTGNPMGALAGAGIGAGAGLLGNATGTTDFLNQRIYPAAMMMGGMAGTARVNSGQPFFNWGGGSSGGGWLDAYPGAQMRTRGLGGGGTLLGPGESWYGF